ncbi:MAG: leucine-rich repeat domain-containing protein [Clostridia bacterium]|nr:leucine-rich repeat domain-containing protein [Clostridia bacterium]
MANKDVFISYKTEEFDDAIWVKSVLESNGITCWMAPMSIPGGSSYAVEIPHAIRNCKVFVLILSEKSQESKWVPKEIDQAINAGKTILPFMLEDCELKDDFNFYLTNVQRYAAYESKTAAIEKMLREIRALLGINSEIVQESVEEADKPVPAPQAEPEPETEPQPQPQPAPVSEPDIVPEKPAKEKAAEKKQKPKAEKKEKPKKEKVKKEPREKAEKSFPKKIFVIGGAVAAAVLVLVLAAVLIMGSGITIAGQEYKKSDTTLELEGIELTESDVDNIKKFKSLSTLRLTSCKLPDKDIGFVSEKVTDVLIIENCGLKDKHLESFDLAGSTLTKLDINTNPDVTKLKGISSLADTLTSLSIRDTGIAEVKFISDLKGLTSLDISGLSLGDDALKEISDCKELTVLSIGGNKLKSLSRLSKLENLVELNVEKNKLEDLEGLEKCIRLEHINAHSNDLYNIDGLANATLLKTVDLSNNSLGDLSELENSAGSIVKLNVANNSSVYNLSAISGSTSLTEIVLDGNSIYDFDDLQGCTSLKYISASDCSILDLDGINEFKALTYLNVSNNYIDYVNGFCGKDDGNGITLDLSYNSIDELDLAVDSNVYYSYLAVYGNYISDLSVLEGAKGGALALEYDEGIDFAGLASAGFEAYYVLECPLDKQVEIEGCFNGSVSFVTEKELNKIMKNGAQE